MYPSNATTWICSVPVATVWTLPESAREVDAHGTGETVKINKWIETMNEQENHDLTHSGLIQTQLLYGEPVMVDEIVDGWAKIIALWQPSSKDERGYPGWVPLHQLKEAAASNELGYARVKVRKAQLWTEQFKPLLVVPFNTLLPVKEQGEFIRVETPDGDAVIKTDEVQLVASVEEIPKGSGSDVAELGEDFLDLQYFWGGMSSYGYDCSGLSYNMLKANGVIIPRDAHDQAAAGTEIGIENQKEWHVGDLLFFAYEEGKGKLHHVGIYYGNGLMIHSPTPGKAIEIIELTGTIYEKELCAVRRFLQEDEK
ncbi:C40 family peptidase [Planomicrobium sp. Y74]|uniref:C40 family peptidase n=1 Tax=Planomicrobium sp. Y74 TaxID=2478977 RepID=UPI000EF4FDB0|nr:C40 family peptidase [Planomicrobium sp. Y74]RLQ86757.1 NlpC/P60 family protein [Planomicrobium sp. Y74]